MRCFNCTNVIPEASVRCPYCGEKVDPTRKITEKDVDINDVDDLNFNNKLDLMKYIKEPSNKKNVLIFGGIIFFLLIIVAALILSLFSKGGSSTNFFTGVVNKVSDYLDDNYLGNSMTGTGSYTLTYNLNGDGEEFSGSYGYDIKNKILSLSGNIKDPKIKEGIIIIDSTTFDYDIYLKNDMLYGKSTNLFNKYILFPLDDITGLLATKNYDISSLIHGILDALETVTKNASIIYGEKTTIDYRGEKTDVKKMSIKLYNENKLKLYKMFYEELIEDANFISEYSRISGKKSDEIKQTLQNEVTNIEYRYDGTSSNETMINAYYSGSNLYRLEIDRTKEPENDQIYIDLGETKYYVTYNKNNENVFYATLSVLSKEVQDIINKTIEFNYEAGNTKLNAILKLKVDLKPNLKKTDVEDNVSIRDLSEEELLNIKNNLSFYISNPNIVDDIKEALKNKCTPELNCDCPEGNNECKCVYNNRFIKCPLSDVEKKSE